LTTSRMPSNLKKFKNLLSMVMGLKISLIK
jgi:hypothetical protein